MRVMLDEVRDLCVCALGVNAAATPALFVNKVVRLKRSAVFSGAPTVNRRFGTKVAVLVGDFLFAQSSWFLAKLDNLEVCNLIGVAGADGILYKSLLDFHVHFSHISGWFRLSSSSVKS